MADQVHDHVSAYIDATVRASGRSRDVLVIIIIASVLIFGSFWNSRGGSWLNTRVRITAEALEYLRLQSQITTNAANPQVVAQLQLQLRDDRFDKVRTFLKARPYYNIGVAEENARKLATIQMERVMFLHLPFFGLVVDINDLGMLGGFAFTVLLLWMRFALWHEVGSLKTTFFDAETHENRVFCYKVLAMQQVLAMPPDLWDDQLRPSHWSKIAKALLLLPIIVHLTVFCYDSFSFQLGWTLSAPNTIINTSVSLLFLIFIAILTYLCFSLWGEMELLWRKVAEEIRKANPTPESQHD